MRRSAVMRHDARMDDHKDTSQPGEPRVWYTVQQVADRLQVNPVTVLRWMRQGELPYLDLGGRKAGYRVRAEVLEEWERKHYHQANDRT